MPKFISDADMAKVEESQPKKAFLSDADMAKLENSQPDINDQSLASKVGNGLLGAASTIGRTYDRFAGAPARAGVASMQKEGSPLSGDANLGISAWANQFGRDPSKAPTGEDLAINAGLSTTPLKKIDKSKEPDFLEKEKKGVLGPAYENVKKQEDERVPYSPAQIGGGFLNAAVDPTLPIGIGELKAPFLRPAAEKAGGLLGEVAEKAAVNSTGATGKQAANFANDAGRQLLDRKVVKFGDSQAKIAERASVAVDKANTQIDSALSSLDKQGATVDTNTVYNTIREKITEMRKDPSTADIADHLEKELDNVLKSAEASGSTQTTLSAAEKTKRGYNRKAGNWADPEKGMSGKEMYRAYKDAVEKAAQAADPATAKLFEEGKKSYGLLRPIQEAAERRAATTSQSPVGGLLDMSTIMAGAQTGSPILPVAGPMMRRLVAPRLSSAAAVGADKISKGLIKASKIGRP